MPVEYICTTCCKRKRRDPAPLPARDRYLSRRIRYVHALAGGRPFVILSGAYGLLAPEDPIPWYDVPLTPAGVAALVPRVAAQLTRRGASRVAFYARPATTPGWAPYHDVLAQACARAGVALVVHELGPAYR